MELPQPTHNNYTTLISNIETGIIKIPQFQRDFVWPLQKSAELLDSIVKGYPIGTFIFWVTRESLRSVKELGGAKLPPAKSGESVSFVLDGQQRLTSLFATLRGLQITRPSGQEQDFAEMYINLTAKETETIVTLDVSELQENDYIRLTDLLYGSLTTLAAYPNKHHKTLEEYKRRIEAYDFPIIEVRNVPIDVATEIFTRLNVGGKKLTVFEIMVAKTYDEALDFDLSEKYTDLVKRVEPLDYETISDQAILQLISLILKKDCKQQTILKLEKSEFIATWPQAIDGVERAIEYFRNVMRIPVSQLLPYLALIVPFAYFFYHNPKKPTQAQKEELEDFFWRCSLGGRYSASLESKLAQDINRMDLVLEGKSPDYDWPVDTSPEFLIENGWFNAGRSFTKALLCLMAYQRPLSFNDNGTVNISNYWLKQANSKNYHHFFPRSFLRKAGFTDADANNIVNITIVDDYLNKREIGAKAPSKYMATFEANNPDLSKTMKTHFIGDLRKFGILEDNYQTFIKERARLLSRQLNKRIKSRKIDQFGQLRNANDESDAEADDLEQ